MTEPVISGGLLGVRRWFPLERHVISDRIEMMVHLSTGNLVVHVRDLSIAGRCDFALNLAHTYNAHAPAALPEEGVAPSFGAHWASLADTRLIPEDDGRKTFVDPTGWYASFTPDGSGGWNSPAGINATLYTESDSTFRMVFHANEETWRFDANGLLTRQECRNHQTITFGHDDARRLSTITDTRGRVTTLSYDGRGRLDTITDPTGRTFGHFTHTDEGRLTSFTDRGGNRVHISYDTLGNLTEIIDANGATWTITYDAQNRVASLAEPLPGGVATAMWRYAYVADLITEVTDPNGNTSRFEFDDQRRQTAAADQLGHRQSQTWTANHDVNTTTSPAGASVTYDYDPVTNNLIGTRLPTGAESSISYADAAHPYSPTEFIDPDNRALRREYDDRGNLTRVWEPTTGINVVRYEYDEQGNITTRTDGKNVVTRFDYNTRGELSATHHPGPRGSEYITYDELSRVVSVTDGNGITVSYDYDWLDRLIQVTDTTSGSRDVRQTTTYDRNGNTISTESPSARMDYTYTPRGQVQSSRTTTGDVHEIVGYGYDPAGNLTWMEQPCATTRYTYDAAYRCTRMTLPEGDEVAFDYDDEDRRTAAHYPDGFNQRWEYDDSGRVTAVEARNGADEVLDRSTYRYARTDGADSGKIQEITGWFSPQPDGASTVCDYDDLGRLTRAGQYTYTFDDATNLISNPEGTFTVNEADEYIRFNDTPLGFDRDGQLTATHDGVVQEYSATAQLTGATTDQGRESERVFATVDNTQAIEASFAATQGQNQYTFTYTALGLGAITTNGARMNVIRDPEGRMISVSVLNGPRYYPHCDVQGSVQAIISDGDKVESTYTYTPYGGTTPHGPVAENIPLRWLGQFQDPTGRYHLNHRYYEPRYGRFTQPDPSGRELNPFAYAMGDPINGMDPSGLVSNWATIWSSLLAGYSGYWAATVVLGSCTVATGGICLVAAGVFAALVAGAFGALGARLGGATLSEVADSGLSSILSGFRTGQAYRPF